jgi:hypothetical protein
MSGDPEQEYFADGMVEVIITALSRIRWLFVIARNSTFTYKGQAVDVKQVGREFGVRYVLEARYAQAPRRECARGGYCAHCRRSRVWYSLPDGANAPSERLRRRSPCSRQAPSHNLCDGPTAPVRRYPLCGWLRPYRRGRNRGMAGGCDAMTTRYFGAPVTHNEDRRLLTGRA